MKLLLKVSLLVNMVSLTILGLLVLKFIKTGMPDTAEPVKSVVAVPAVSTEPTRSAEAFTRRTFSWQQIESTNYRTFVANLRSIGCPEQTVADIIRADVHSLYTTKRAEAGATAPSPGALWSVSEEEAIVAALLGGGDPQINSPGLPIVMKDVDPELLQLDAEQQAAILELRAQFIEDIGGTNQNPSAPAYAARWERAQGESDRSLRGMIGVNAFMRYQNETR